MTHYTNPHTFNQYSRVCIKKSIKLRLSYAFADFRNIAQRAKLCKTVQNVPNSFYNFKWKTRVYLWIVEIRCWIFLTNFIPKYHCARLIWCKQNYLPWDLTLLALSATISSSGIVRFRDLNLGAPSRPFINWGGTIGSFPVISFCKK